MTLPYQAYTLIPNIVDGKQRMGDWDGTFEPTAPDPVTDLSAVATGSTTVQLSWTAVAGADEYNIQRAPNNGLWSSIGATTDTIYGDTGLTASSTYQYRIFTSNENGWGDVSNTISVTTEASIPQGDTDLSQIYLYVDFSDYNDGDSVNSVTPLWAGSTPGDETFIDSSVTISGRATGRSTIVQGRGTNTGNSPPLPGDQFNYWGGGYTPGNTMAGEGDEIWYRVYEQLDSGWDWGTDPDIMQAVKVLRVRKHAGGYNDIYYRTPGHAQGEGSWQFISEVIFGGPDQGGWELGTKLLNFGQMYCFEVYYKLSSDPNIGEMRFWIDGVQQGPTVNQRTLVPNLDPPSLATINQTNFHTVWASPAITDNLSYWGGYAIALKSSVLGRDDSIHLDRDTTGFPYIGTTT